MKMNIVGDIDFPPFFFHYILVFLCASFILCVCVLKLNYLFWYSQPITFWFTLQRFGRGEGLAATRVMNPLLHLGYRCHTAVVYPFLHFVSHDNVIVYGGGGVADAKGIADAPYEKIATFLSRREKEVIMPGRRSCILGGDNDGFAIPYVPPDIFEYILSNETYGLSAFIGVLIDGGGGGGGGGRIKGVCVLTPRIMMVRMNINAPPVPSVCIYVCDHLAWENYTTSTRESLELLETTEYIQKSREIAGEQTLYRYREIPRFVIPFTTAYTYTFSYITPVQHSLDSALGITLIPVSSSNFALFYAFVNECARDFRYCIFHELTQLQSLVQGGIYRIYMLVLNKIRVVAVYIFEPSWMKVSPQQQSTNRPRKTVPKKTLGNRITALHDHISRTSTALVKYLPPSITPKYDVFGKRIKAAAASNVIDATPGTNILLLKSSIQHKTLCERSVFVHGFNAAIAHLSESSTTGTGPGPGPIVCIDTIAHNYYIIDELMLLSSYCSFVSQDKWYYILYNAIIHQEVVCKDILVI